MIGSGTLIPADTSASMTTILGHFPSVGCISYCLSWESAQGYETGMSSPSLTGTVLNSKWRLGALVGAGACADVYEAMDVSAGATAESGKFVAKICPLPVDLPPRPQWRRKEEKRKADTLYHEHMLYRGFLLPRLRNLGCVVEVSAHGPVGQD